MNRGGMAMYAGILYVPLQVAKHGISKSNQKVTNRPHAVHLSNDLSRRFAFEDFAAKNAVYSPHIHGTVSKTYMAQQIRAVSYTHLRAHETEADL
eukprot:2998326-Amphidinium_carterae.1